MATLLPKQLRFLLADAVREETGGKLTVIGLYTGDEVVLQGALPVEVPEGVTGIALQGLAILVTFDGGYGEFQIEVQLYDPTGKALGPGSQISAAKGKDVAQNIVLPFMPFPVRAFGRYRLVLLLNKRKYEYSFTVRHQDPDARLPTRSVPITPKRKDLHPSRGRVKKNRPSRPPERRILE